MTFSNLVLLKRWFLSFNQKYFFKFRLIKTMILTLEQTYTIQNIRLIRKPLKMLVKRQFRRNVLKIFNFRPNAHYMHIRISHFHSIFLGTDMYKIRFTQILHHRNNNFSVISIFLHFVL